MRSLKTVLALVLAAALAGCFHDGGAGTVALVDLDSVAKQLGRSTIMNDELKQLNAEVTGELQKAANEMKSQIEASARALQSNPSAEARTQHQQLIAQSTRSLEEQKRAAAKQVQDKRQSLILSFRLEARPAVEKVARARGARIVLTAADSVMWAERELDITSEVLAEMGGPKDN